jgi:hypothetical protein
VQVQLQALRKDISEAPGDDIPMSRRLLSITASASEIKQHRNCSFNVTFQPLSFPFCMFIFINICAFRSRFFREINAQPHQKTYAQA